MDPKRLIELGAPPPLAKEFVNQLVGAVLPAGSVTNAKVADNAAIATSKLADGDDISALITDLGGMLKVRKFAIAYDDEDIASGVVLVQPEAGEVLHAYYAVVTEAWDSGASDSLDIGITGNTDALIDAADAQTPGLCAVGTDGADGAPYLFDGATDVIATVTSAGEGGPSQGAAVFVLVTIPTA